MNQICKQGRHTHTHTKYEVYSKSINQICKQGRYMCVCNIKHTHTHTYTLRLPSKKYIYTHIHARARARAHTHTIWENKICKALVDSYVQGIACGAMLGHFMDDSL